MFAHRSTQLSNQKLPSRGHFGLGLAAAVLTCGILLGTAESASATTTKTYTQYSSDTGGKAVVKVVWYGQNHFYATWTNSDIVANGRGPILILEYLEHDTNSATYYVDYDHDTSGYKTSDLSTDDVVDAGGIGKVVIRECDGGNSEFPQNCDETDYSNPSF